MKKIRLWLKPVAQSLSSISFSSPASSGQSLVIFAVVLLGLLFFIGLAVDSGALYVRYGQLKRAVDAAAIAAANEFKTGNTLDHMTEASTEVLRMHSVDMSLADLDVFICDADGDGVVDSSLQATAPQFYALCPDTTQVGTSPRKLVWVEASMVAQFYFLQLLGIPSVTLRADAMAEAAPVDLVLVIDVSESMGNATVGFVRGNFDPTDCNLHNNCQPLLQAKTAAKSLIDKLHLGYDQVSIVTFDSRATVWPIENLHGAQVNLSDNMISAKETIDTIQLHDDPPAVNIWLPWRQFDALNPVNPEDRDGDGRDADPALPTCADNPGHPLCCTLYDGSEGIDYPNCPGVPVQARWDCDPAKFSAYNFNNGFPCDDDNLIDSYDWANNDNRWTNDDANAGNAWASGGKSLSPLSTCTGCGLREGANILKQYGRSNAVWVIVFLSDGTVNLSDTPLITPRGIGDTPGTSDNVGVTYTNGFCGGQPFSEYWTYYCIDRNPGTRYCIDDEIDTCPPGTIYEDPATTEYKDMHYSVYDYALDMVDNAALLKSTNINEPAGNDIAIYAIGLGEAGDALYGQYIGESLLRYMAAVGDDGDRTTRPCDGVAHGRQCGQYYYAPTGQALLPIFEDIASRIYTRITR